MQGLSDSDWERIREYFPEENIPDGRPGRKPVPARQVLDAVLWILNTGAQWHMLPQCYRITRPCIAAFSSGVNARFCARF
jgi:transposase